MVTLHMDIDENNLNKTEKYDDDGPSTKVALGPFKNIYFFN